MQFLLVSSSRDLDPRSYPEAHFWVVGTRSEAVTAASHPGPPHGAHEFVGTPREGGAGTRMRPIPRGILRIQASRPWILRSDWEVDLRAQGHTSAGWRLAGNPDSQVTRQASALRCFAVWCSLGLPLHQPGRQTVFAWGRPGECRVTSKALDVILSNGMGVRVGVAAC